MGFAFSQVDEEHFRIESGYYDCGLMSASIDPTDFEVVDGLLLQGDVEVGAIGEGFYSLSLTNEDEGFVYRAEFRWVEGEEATYEENWDDLEGNSLLRVSGKLQPLEPDPES
jgi:hypothetical protein